MKSKRGKEAPSQCSLITLSRAPPSPDIGVIFPSNSCGNFSSPVGRIFEGILEGGFATGRGGLGKALPDDSTRMETRLLRETRSVFEYLFQHLPTVSRVNIYK
jgi:hypothetical protein